MSDAEIVFWFFGLWFLGMALAIAAYVVHSRRKTWVRPPSTHTTTPHNTTRSQP